MAIKDLEKLLDGMNPVLSDKEFVFCMLPHDRSDELKFEPLMKFRESEGISIITERQTADQNSMSYSSLWSMITLSVYSDLSAVGFLAAITSRLAEHGISVNAVSAYHHDYLFVPTDRANEAMKVLSYISK